MAQCIQLDAQGRIDLVNQSISDCTGYILMDVVDYTNYPTLSAIFDIPITSDLQTVWMLGFGLPMIVFLSSWALNQVVTFINSK